MEHSIELIFDVRPSPDLVDETLNRLGSAVEEAAADSKLRDVTKQGPELRVAQREPGTIVGWIIVGVTFMLVTGPQAFNNLKTFIGIVADQFQKQTIPLHKLEVKLDGKVISRLEASADQLLQLDVQNIGKDLERRLKQANES